MKLRNKKTGEVTDNIWFSQIADGIVINGNSYKNLDEINKEWEDYKPAEPLIKDEEVRNAVRAWAEATGTTSVSYWGELESEQNDSKIEFDGIAVAEFGDNYTIAELCGEEEE